MCGQLARQSMKITDASLSEEQIVEQMRQRASEQLQSLEADLSVRPDRSRMLLRVGRRTDAGIGARRTGLTWAARTCR
jgi:hypothetical protein